MPLTGVYLESKENKQDDHRWWCDPENDSGTRGDEEEEAEAVRG